MIIYISGGITNVPDYMKNFQKAEDALQVYGHKTLNPAKILEPVADAAGYEELMQACIKLLDVADAIYMLDGWQHSPGANREFDHANKTGKEILYQTRGALG